MSTVRCLIDLAVQNDWKLFQIDVYNANLYGSLSEDVYMLPPPGFFDKNDKRVFKLKKSLYGLKQAPRQCNHKLYETLIEAGFKQSKNDHSLYIKNDGDVSLYLLVYVDDLVITGNSKTEIKNFKSFLNKKFKINDLGELKYFLVFLLASLVSCTMYDGAEENSKADNFSQVVKGEYFEIRAHIHQDRAAVLNKSRHSS
ncbi:ribonuclease H-like domain-containing protein, partial [Tanacetum coccineum]